MNEEVAGPNGVSREGKVSVYMAKLSVLLCIVGMALVVAGEGGKPKFVGLLMLAVVGASYAVMWAASKIGVGLRLLGGQSNG